MRRAAATTTAAFSGVVLFLLLTLSDERLASVLVCIYVRANERLCATVPCKIVSHRVSRVIRQIDIELVATV